jgi:hypothetical protein
MELYRVLATRERISVHLENDAYNFIQKPIKKDLHNAWLNSDNNFTRI